MSSPSVWRNSMVMAPSKDGAIKTQGYKPRFSATHRSDPLPPKRGYFEGLIDKPPQTIDIPDNDEKEEDIHISECSYIGSYNWIKEDSGTPTILVPGGFEILVWLDLILNHYLGSPSHWQNRQLPYTIPPDRGIQFCDQNGHKMPKAILLPLIVAVNKRFEMAKQPAFDWSAIDIITDRNNLRKLMRWAGGNSDDFRIDLQLAGKKTILMNRFSERHMNFFNGRTYGFSFERSSTIPAPGCRASSGHHRIITYVRHTIVLAAVYFN